MCNVIGPHCTLRQDTVCIHNSPDPSLLLRKWVWLARLPQHLPLLLPLPSTSTDRYANVDVGVLLYHIERFPGIIILTTNLIDNIDKAFFRRLRFVLPLDAPPRNLRARLWKVC